jgi:predicted metal-binding membrane protein
MATAALESLLRRDRALVLAGILTLAGLSWLYLFRLDAAMKTAMATDVTMPMSMPMMLPWSATEFLLTFVMWAVMMVAMMAPSAAPMVLTFATVQRNRARQSRPFVSSGFFLAGYLVAWTAFSAVATLAQWALHAAAVLNPHQQAVAPWLGGVFLVVTGIYQLTPAKNACLRHCRSPLDFLARHWRAGRRGALVLGLHHGLYCVGCCWLLMLLLFVAGVMNLLWVAAIAVFVLLEKVVPRGTVVAYAGGGLMLVAGLLLLARAVVGS